MGSHINEDGKFQSDKYPGCPAGKVPLSVEDATAQDLLYEYAQRRRPVDAEFTDDLERALKDAGYDGVWNYYPTWRRWFEMGERHLSAKRWYDGAGFGVIAQQRSLAASFMRWLTGEELLGNGPMSKRKPGSTFSIIIGHLEFVHDSLHALRNMLLHVGYTEAETATLMTAFKLMFPQVPEYVREDITEMHSKTIFSTVYSRKIINDIDLRAVVQTRVGEQFDAMVYDEVLKDLEARCVRRNGGSWEYFERAAESPKNEASRDGDAVVLVKEPFVPNEQAVRETVALMQEITERQKKVSDSDPLVKAARFDLKEYEDAILGIIKDRGPVSDIDLKGGVRGLLGDALDEDLYAEAFEVLQTTPDIKQNTSGDWEIAPPPFGAKE